MWSPKTLRKRTLLACLLVVLTSFWLGRLDNQDIHSAVPTGEESDLEKLASTTALVPVGTILPRALPTTLSIPALNLTTSFTTPLGLSEAGEVAVPDDYEQVGWYENSPTPGELGPAIVLGHVDSYRGPAIFYSLGQLKPGDDIFISRDDGSQAHFVVTLLERYEQVAFPTQKVYGNIDHAGLRLITCSGVYVRGEQRYTHNLVVYAKLVESV